MGRPSRARARLHRAQGAREHERRRRPPPPPPGREKGASSGRGNGVGRGAAAGEGEGRVREALHGRENEEHEETLGTTMEVITGEEDPRRSREEIRRLPEIRGFNRRTERAATKPSTRRTQGYPRIRQTKHGLVVIARRSCRRSWNRSKLRRAIPGARDRIWRKRFVFWNELDEMKLNMYIYLGFERDENSVKIGILPFLKFGKA
jgi:hypothetical protein